MGHNLPMRGKSNRRRPLGTLDKVILAVALLVGVYLLAISLWGQDGLLAKNRPAVEVLSELPATEAGVTLLSLPGADDAQVPKYQRDKFGPAWADVTHSGCDTRNEILDRDMDNVEYRPGTRDCVVERGKLSDPYTGEEIHFRKGNKTSTAVQIDHVVALSDAWRSGAFAWDDQQRLRFANDPLNLLAVDGPANQRKSDYAADEWLPDNGEFHCDFAARQVAVKNKYSLTVTDTERDALAQVLVGCPDQTLPR